MGYQRATWHSGLTYSQTCSQCKTQVTYMDNKLDFRPWYPDGFVYCPTCNTPLRHNETYAINRPVQPTTVDMTATNQVNDIEITLEQNKSVTEPVALFCTNCGKAFGQGDNFCSNCGKKR